MSLKGCRDVPYPLGTPEWASFKNYVVAYFKEAIEIAKKVAQETTSTGPWAPQTPRLFDYVFDKAASPLVYLWEKWQLMSIDDKLKYATPEYAKELERIKAESQKVKDKVKDENWGGK